MLFERKYKLCQAVGDGTSSGTGNGPKKVTINGKEMDYAEFLQKALEKAHAWALSLGLSTDLENDFNEALSDILSGVSNGAKYDNGKYYGNFGNNDNYYGKFTGNKKDGSRAWNGIKRNGYDPYGNVVAFINNKVVGSVAKVANIEELKAQKSKNKKWSNTAISSHVGKGIWQLTPEAEINMTEWADNLGDVLDETSLTRKVDNRLAVLKNHLKTINLDNYDGLSDEDKTTYKGIIDTAINGDSKASIEAMKQLGLGSLLFTTKDYLGKPLSLEEKDLLEELKKKKEAELYKQTYNKQYNDWLNQTYGLDVVSQLLYNLNITSEQETALDDIIRNGYDWSNFLSNLDTDVSNNFNNIKDWTTLESFGLVNPYGDNIYRYDDQKKVFGSRFVETFNPLNTTFALHPKYNPILYRLLAYNDILRRLIANKELDDYKVGANEYMILDSMDKDGNVLVYNNSLDNPTITKTNVRKYKDRKDLATLWKLIADLYAKFNGINTNISNTNGNVLQLNFNKNGGIMKLALGDKMAALYLQLEAAKNEALNAMTAEERLQYMQAEKQAKIDNRKVADDFTTTDMMRIGALAADLTSAVAAWAPGIGTGVSIATGLTATGTNFLADLNEGKTLWDSLKTAGAGVAMDLVGSLAGVGMGAKSAKIVSGLVKWAPRLITIASAAGMAPEFIDALKGLNDSSHKLTAKELRTLAYGMSALAGINRMSATAYNKMSYKNAASTGLSKINILDKDGNQKQVIISTSDAQRIAGAENKQEGTSILLGIKGNSNIKEGDLAAIQDSSVGWKPTTWLSFKKNNTNPQELYDYSKIHENPEKTWGWVNSLGLFYSRFGLNNTKTNALRLFGNNFSTTANMPKVSLAEVKSAVDAATSLGVKIDDVLRYTVFLSTLKSKNLSLNEINELLKSKSWITALKTKYKFKNGGCFVPKYQIPWSPLNLTYTTFGNSSTYNTGTRTLVTPIGNLNGTVTHTGNFNSSVTPLINLNGAVTKTDNFNDTFDKNTFTSKLLLERFPVFNYQFNVSPFENTLSGRLINYMSGDNKVDPLYYRLINYNKVDPLYSRFIDYMKNRKEDESKSTKPKTYDKSSNVKSNIANSAVPTGLELLKYGLTALTNKDIDDLKLKPFLKIVNLNHAILKGEESYLNQALRSGADIMHTGELIANNTSDLGVGSSALLNAALKRSGVLADGLYKYNQSVLNSEAKVLSTADLNELLRVGKTNDNELANVANDNQEKIKHAQFLNKNNANNNNLLNLIENGYLQNSQYKYSEAMLKYLQGLPEYKTYTDYKNKVNELYTANPSFDPSVENAALGWTKEDIANYNLVTSSITNLLNLWKELNPYKLPIAFGFKSGGKMAEAEREKTRRYAAKLFHDTVKHTNIMSHKAIKDSSAASLYLLKKMMQG